MSKLISQGGFGCVYYPGIKCDGSKDSRRNVVTKLQRKNPTAENEIYIGELIKRIPNYRMFFLPVIDSCPVNIRDVDSELITDCKVVASSGDLPFILMTIPYVSNRGFFETLTDFSLGKKQILLTITETYSYLLSAIKYLLDANVVHFDLKGENVLYNLVSTDPQIIDFGISLPISKVTPGTWRQYFYAYAPEYYVWPLEVHLINFLLHESSPLKKSDIPDIASRFTKNNKALEPFSADFREKYQSLCEVCLQTYIGKPKEQVIPLLVKQHPSWDNYSLSALYLRTFSYMFPKNLHRNPVLIQFSQLLLLNLSPDFSTRLSLDETKKKFSGIFFSQGDVGSYRDLVDTLDYDSAAITRRIKEDIQTLRTAHKSASHPATLSGTS